MQDLTKSILAWQCLSPVVPQNRNRVKGGFEVRGSEVSWVLMVMGEGPLSNQSLSPLLRQVNKQNQLRVPGGQGEESLRYFVNKRSLLSAPLSPV